MENTKRLSGAIFSAPMFFKSNGEVDYDSYEKYIAKCVKSEGVEVIYAMAYNTRFRQLSVEEIVKVSKITCDLSNSFGKKAIIGHPYTVTSKGLDAFCSNVSKFKPYAISVLYPERYYGMTKPLQDFFNIPKKYNINVLVHEQKLVSGFNGTLIDWPDDLINCILEEENIIAVKEDSKDNNVTSKFLKLSEKYNFDVIVAGGGKRRVKELIKYDNLKCWLNGSLMLFPELAKIISEAYLNNDIKIIKLYEEKIEIPYFDDFISKVGWHVGHKAALHILGYCELYEREPMPTISNEKFIMLESIIHKMKNDAQLILKKCE